jgi:hypothetical protein
VLGSIVMASATVKTLTVCYVTDWSVFLVVDRQIGQGWIDRSRGWKHLKQLGEKGAALTVFARCLIPA